MGGVKRVRKLSIRDYYGFLKTLGLLNLGIFPNLLFFYFKCVGGKRRKGWRKGVDWERKKRGWGGGREGKGKK